MVFIGYIEPGVGCFVKLNPFMPGDIIDRRRLDLSYF